MTCDITRIWTLKNTHRVKEKDKSPVSLFPYSILGPHFLSFTFPRPFPAKSLEHKQGLCLPPRDLPRLHPSLPTKGTRKPPSQVLCRHQRWLLQNFWPTNGWELNRISQSLEKRWLHDSMSMPFREISEMLVKTESHSRLFRHGIYFGSGFTIHFEVPRFSETGIEKWGIVCHNKVNIHPILGWHESHAN